MSARHVLALGAMLFAASFLPPSAIAAEPTTPAVADAQKKVQGALSRWDLAKQNLDQRRSNAQSLEHRIAALKRLRLRGSPGADAELTTLLRESVAQDAALRTATKEVDQREAEVRRSVVEAFATIDARIKEIRPRLRMGEIESRRATARAIVELRDIRSELRGVVDRLRVPNAAPQVWSKYQVKIDPLDGPKELKEKADFVEDTRDRFTKKREQVKRLIKEMRDDQSLRNAAKDFRTDTGIFDEENRRDRVAKQTNRERDLAQTPASDPSPAEQPPPLAGVPNQGVGGGRGAETQSPPPDQAFDTNTPPAQQPQVPLHQENDKTFDDAGTFAGGGDPGRPTTPPGGGDPGVTPSPQIPKQLDLNALLNLQVEGLQGGVDLATLEALAMDLAKLDHILDLQAQELRKRAQQLKEDEDRALGGQK